MLLMKERIRKWHPGKIAILWFFAFVLLVSLLRTFRSYNDFAGVCFVWTVICFPLVVVTWIWLGGREK